MWGGQKKKEARRFGIPVLALTFASNHLSWKHFSLLLYVPLLSIGYGVNSWLMDWLGNETLVRVAYALLLSIPIALFGVKKWFLGTIMLVMAFQIRGGSLGHLAWFGDILIVDFIRYSVLAIVLMPMVFYKKS